MRKDVFIAAGSSKSEVGVWTLDFGVRLIGSLMDVHSIHVPLHS